MQSTNKGNTALYKFTYKELLLKCKGEGQEKYSILPGNMVCITVKSCFMNVIAKYVFIQINCDKC